jgi:hypothetical protein
MLVHLLGIRLIFRGCTISLGTWDSVFEYLSGAQMYAQVFRVVLSCICNYLDGQGMQHEWGRGGMHIGYWWESQKEIGHWED